MAKRRRLQTYSDEADRARIPKDKLFIMDILTECFKDELYELARKNDIMISNEKDIYSFKREYCFKNTHIINSTNKTAERSVVCGIAYWKKNYDSRYNDMFSIDMSIDSEITYMLDYSIWILEYIYRNDPDFFQKLFKDKEDRLVKWSRGTDVQYYNYFFFHSKELDFVKYMIKEILQWLFARKEIIEVLKGERWIKGYIPPTPY